MNNLFNFDEKLIHIENKKKVKLYAKIDHISVQKTVNGSDFLNMNLIDDTCVMNAKKWNIEEVDKSFKAGQVVFINGYGSEYNGKVQLIIENIRLVNEFDQVDLSIFYPQAPIELEQLKTKLNHYMSLIKNESLKKITIGLYKKFEDQYLVFPAATKNHHAYISGLAHHVCTMLDVSSSLSKIYEGVNTDLLYSGIILHDIGKVIELSDHMSPEYTTVGRLIGHINLAFEEIRLMANEHNIVGEEVVLLQHLILSHHGLLEYGSPKTPMLIEAELLNLIDVLDSRMNMITSELKDTNDSDFTKRIHSLDGRSFYKPKL